MDESRMTAIQKYLAENPSLKETPGGVHIHFHNGPVIQDPQPVEQNPGMKVLERYTPYLVIGALCCVPVGGLALVVVLMVPAILALTAMVVGSLLAVAVCAIAVSAAIRNMREVPAKGKRK
jgi:hypothetical protein